MNKYFVESDGMVDKALELLAPHDELSCDTETDGLSPHVNKLWSVQLGHRNESFLFPYNALNEASKAKLRLATKGKTLIAHNAKFDVKFLLHHGFLIDNAYCTMEAEKTLYAGKYYTYGLKDLLHRRFQIKMDKAPREDFYNGVFEDRIKEFGDWEAWTEELIEYALEDIVYLHEIKDQQTEEARELGVDNVHWLENSLVPVVARMENRGAPLDVKATKKFQSVVTLRRDEISRDIFGLLEKSYSISWQKRFKEKMALWDTWSMCHKKVVEASNKLRDPLDKRKKTPEALMMVEESNKNKPFSTKPKEDIPFKPSSPAHLCMALTHATDFPVTTTAKEWLEENIHIHPVIEDLVEFRKFEKLVQFCDIQETVCILCGRIHASFHQNGTKSGRFSCSDPNLQQIPARSDEAKEFRALFRPKKGRKFVGADLAGIELVILAYFANETGLLDAINTGKDVHCYTMSLFLACPYEILVKAKGGEELTEEEDDDLTSARESFESTFQLPELLKIEDHTAWVKKLRDYIKTITYGLSYGLSKWGLSRKFHCTPEDAEKFIAIFFNAYPNLKVFLSQQEEMGYTRGYAVNPLGRRRWFRTPAQKKYPEIEKEVMAKLDKDKRLWDSVTDEEWDMLMQDAVKEARREYNRRISGIKRQAGNFFPQSLCAEMIKLAMWLFDKEFRDKVSPKPEDGLILTVHDELIAECDDADAEVTAEVLTDTMVRAVKKFMPNVEVKVDAKVMEVWEK